ncbi:hypothetical protein ACFC9N_10545 [Enterococcus casseliflavus]|uniref:hypothetical protein n=1 Tax=Enterococcus TaxID=1350 RepID=UPI000A387281|nr:hypothetical protein [Enterococcus sp. 4E1_DIV0656]OTO09105.1 hypothetical protein A5882_003435 [Enterococcus sp. 4E1_DIV0656]
MFQSSDYSKTYTSFSGSDITATIGTVVIGTLQSITYSVTREKAPIYTMGDPNPKSFSRGKRGIAGSLVFTVFDRDSLKEIKSQSLINASGLNTSAIHKTGTAPEGVSAAAGKSLDSIVSQWQTQRNPVYTDEIPPFDITITFMNEYGQSASMIIFGVECLNEGMGMSVDDITTERAVTFVARAIEDLSENKYENID